MEVCVFPALQDADSLFKFIRWISKMMNDTVSHFHLYMCIHIFILCGITKTMCIQLSMINLRYTYIS